MRRPVVGMVLIVACGSAPALDSAWGRRATMTVPRSEMPAALLDGEVWVPGGLTDNLLGFSGSAVVEVYDPAADTWREGPDLPEARHHAMAAVLEQEIYVIGGMGAGNFTPTDTAWRLADSGWVPIVSLPEPRAAGAAVALGGSIYVLGGVPAGHSVLRYDGDTEQWVEVASLAQAREHIAAATFNERIWVVGGRWTGEMLSSVEVYDPATDQWSGGPELLEGRSGFALVALASHLVALGGEVFAPTRSLDSVEVLVEGEWQQGPPLPEGLHGVPAVAVDGAVYVLGGSRRAGGIDNPGDVWRIGSDDLVSGALP